MEMDREIEQAKLETLLGERDEAEMALVKTLDDFRYVCNEENRERVIVAMDRFAKLREAVVQVYKEYARITQTARIFLREEA